MGRRPPSRVPAAEAAALFRALGNPVRLRLLVLLRGRGEVCVGDLTAAVGLTQGSVSNHLSRLRLAGAVAARRRGRRVYYRVASPLVAGLLGDVEAG